MEREIRGPEEPINNEGYDEYGHPKRLKPGKNDYKD
jgi:hypothetical protein